MGFISRLCRSGKKLIAKKGDKGKASTDAAPTSSQEPRPYRHFPLDTKSKEIRIISLLPARDKSAPLEAQMIHAPLGEAADRYFALSYTWGDVSDKVPIAVDGHRIDVTKNLDSALRHIRHEDSALPLWIDYICINQGDNEEKSEQVLLMRHIYSSAHSVIAWLGEANEMTAKAYTLIADLTNTFVQHKFEASEELKNWICDAVVDTEQYSWDGVLDLVSRPYWSRIWIIQEIVVAKETMIRCGDFELPYEYFLTLPGAGLSYGSNILQTRVYRRMNDAVAADQPVNLMNVLKDIEKESSVGFNFIGHLSTAREYFKRDHYETFYDMVRMFRDNDATDPRDKIYALLGLASQKHVEAVSIKPDYTMPLDAVFLDYVQTHARTYGRLDFLWDASGVDRPEGFSSWMPHYGAPEQISKLRFLEIPKLIAFNAARDMPAEFEFVDSGRTLNVKGIEIGTIEKLSDRIESVEAQPRRAWELAQIGTDIVQSAMASWAEIAGAADTFAVIRNLNPRTGEPSGSSSSAPMSQSEINDKLAEIDPSAPLAGVFEIPAGAEEKPYSFITDGNITQKPGDRIVIMEPTAKYVDGTPIKVAFTRTTVMNPSAPLDINYINNSRYISQAEMDSTGSLGMGFSKGHQARRIEVCEKRKFFVTDTKYMGVAGLQAEKGDIVVVILGTKVPFLLRKSNNDYFIVGEAYVQAMMEGEAIEKMKSGENEPKVFSLR